MANRESLIALRDLAAFFRTPYSTMEQLYERNGPVSWIGAGPLRFALLLGPEANRFLFARSELFSWRAAFAGLIPLAGEGALIVNDGAEHRRLRQLVQPAFTRRKVDIHLATVQRHVRAVRTSWSPGDEVDIYRHFQRALRHATIESLFGTGLVARADELTTQLQLIHNAIDQNAITRRLQRFGLPSWRRAVAARDRVRSMVVEEIARRRAEPSTAGSDVLGLLLAGRDEDGSMLDEREISDQLVSMLEAGAETTSAAFGWAVYSALRDPTIWSDLAAEIGEHVPEGEPMTADLLHRMSRLDRVVSETLRLYPPTVIGPRKVAAAFTFADHEFPVGTTLMYSPYVTHRLAELWPDPLRFDPLRWDPEQPGYRRAGAHEYLPFGGGPHRCIGSAFATMTVKATLVEVVRHTRLDLVSRDVRPTGLIGMRPKDGLVVRVGA